MGTEKKIESNLKKLVSAHRPTQLIRDKQWRGATDQEFFDQVGIESLTVKLAETMSRGEVLKNGSKSFVSHVTLGGADVVIKGYRHLGLLHSVRHMLKGSRAKQAWVTANRLCHLAVPTPRPLAYINEYRGALLWRSFFLYEYISGPGLHAVLADPAITAEHKRRLIDHVLMMLKRMSENGISHGDLKHTNLICQGDHVVFIDLDAMRQVPRIGWLKRYQFERDKARFLRDIKRI